jgi:hypothetical protein
MDKRGLLQDGFLALPRGVSSGKATSLLTREEVSFAINATFRADFADIRPGFVQVPLTFEDEDAQELFSLATVQGAALYDAPSGTPELITSSEGRIWSLNPDTGSVQEITPVGDRNPSNRPQAWLCQAENYMVIQDGQSLPIIYDGATSRRSAFREVPVGRQMAYGLGRLFVVLPNSREFRASDFVDSPGGVLSFTEDGVLLGGGTISPPLETGDITALVFTAQQNTVSGQGSLLCFTRSAVTSFNPIPNRQQWGNISFASIALITSGATSQDATCVVNGDVFFRAPDGIRSFVMAQRDFSNSWGNTPMSREMDRVLSKDTEALLLYGDAVTFDNRILFTVSPRQITNNCSVHYGMVALNFDNVSSMYDKSMPAYDGLWTGIKPYKLVSGFFGGRERCFAFCRGADGDTQLWEITKDARFDNGNCPIQAVIETPAYSFGDPSLLKTLWGGELWRDRVFGQANVDIKYRPDQHVAWFDWASINSCATTASCDPDDFVAGCHAARTYRPQYRPREQLSRPDGQCIPESDNLSNSAYEFQFRIAWSGSRLKQFRAFASGQPDAANKPKCG